MERWKMHVPIDTQRKIRIEVFLEMHGDLWRIIGYDGESIDDPIAYAARYGIGSLKIKCKVCGKSYQFSSRRRMFRHTRESGCRELMSSAVGALRKGE